MLYTYGVELDRPLAFRRDFYEVEARSYEPVTIVPNYDWRGSAAGGRLLSGQDASAGDFRVEWPSRDIRVYGTRYTPRNPQNWFGSQIDGRRDASGLQYMRNRYYDPDAGRFTQEDPIGLAGGLNLYGYAGGDPVSYSDPFGLCPKKVDNGTLCIDLFIAARRVGPLRGDGRGFDSDAGPTRSRAQIIITPSNLTGSYATISPTCVTGAGCFAPRSDNGLKITAGEGGSFTVTFNLKNSAAPFGASPDIDGSVTFTPDGNGGFTTTGDISAFPSNAIYQRVNGRWVDLKPPHKETSPFDLFDGRGRDKW